MENNIRVRYGKVNNQAKNTLVTIRNGDTIYFGISRCRLSADKVSKEEGKKKATIRATVAAQNVAPLALVDGTSCLFVHKTGLFGNINFKDILVLLSYFEKIDNIMLPSYLRK